MQKNLFMAIMEADGDELQPFDAADDAPAGDMNQPTNQQQATSPATDANDNEDLDGPPPLADDTGGDLQYSDDNGNMYDDGGDDDNQTDQDDDKGKEKLSQKVDKRLNQRLYQQMLDRNNDIENIIDNVQTIVPLLPYEVIKVNDVSLNRLKQALSKGQDYVIHKFLDSGYGENLLYFQKLDSLYTLLLEDIDANLKKIVKKQS